MIEETENPEIAGPPPGSADGTERRAIIVLGMHRSGTSALARVVNLLGARLPGELIGAKSDNEQGFFEPKQLVSLHDRMLSELDSAWDDFLSFPDNWSESKSAKAIGDEIRSFLKKDLGAAPLFAVKDPRMCRLLPIWATVLEGLGPRGAQPRFVHVFRNPVEVATSLARRNGFHPTKSYLLWLRHVLDAERDTRGQARTFVNFASLIADPRVVVDRICATVGIDPASLDASAVDNVCAHLAKGSRHHVATRADLEADADCPAWVRDAYDALIQLEQSEGNVASSSASAAMDAIAAKFDDASAGFASLLRDYDADAQFARRQAKLRSYFLTGEPHEEKRRNAELTRLVVLNRDAARFTGRLSEALLEILARNIASGSPGARKLSWALAYPWRQMPRFRRSYKLIRRARRFDEEFYASQVPGLDRLGADPLAHYLIFGWRSDLRPAPDFEPAPESLAPGVCPLVYKILYRPRH